MSAARPTAKFSREEDGRGKRVMSAHHRGSLAQPINLMPGDPGWSDYLRSFDPGPEREKVRQAGQSALAERKKKEAEEGRKPESA